jgi:Zn-dependent protease with chaperone function
MRFVRRNLGKAAEASSGGGGRGLAKEIIVLVGASLALIAGLYFAVGWGVDRLLPFISFEREQRWFSGLRPASPHESNGERADDQLHRVSLLLDRLTALVDAPPLSFSIAILSEEDPNAFAIPGGTIGVTTGLLEILSDDIALAFVLGHELGHFSNRDHLRGLGRRIGHALVWTIVFGSSGGDLVGDRLTRFLNLRYSRRQEERADAYGLRLVYETYVTVEGTDRLFGWLDQNRDLPAWAAILSTHPDPMDRIDKLRRLANELATSTEAASNHHPDRGG